MHINTQRLGYIMKLYSLSKEDLCALLNAGLDVENQLTVDEFFAGQLNRAQRNRLVEVSGKRLGFWMNAFSADRRGYDSILYRKHRFNCELTHQDRLLVVREEDHAKELSWACDDLSIRLKRTLPRFNAKQKAAAAAYKVRALLELEAEYASPRKFLEDLARRLAERNIVVNEHIDGKGKPTNLAGFFIKKHTIVFKRHWRRSRELFTLAHELGHYMLEDEDIDAVSLHGNLKGEERWCNDFAFHLILGPERVQKLDAFTDKQMHDALGVVSEFADRHHISSLALYYYFRRAGRISLAEYKEKEQLIKRKSRRGKISATPPLLSSLERGILIAAFNEDFLEGHDLGARYKGLLPYEKIFSAAG